MGLSITASDAIVSNYVASLTLPDMTGVVFEQLLGTSDANSLINHANVGAPATKIGAPVYGADYATLLNPSGTGNGFNTGIACPANFTAIAVIRIGSGLSSFLCKQSQYSGFVNNGSLLNFYNNQAGVAPAVAQVATPTHGKFFVVAGVAPLGGYGSIHIWQNGVRTTVSATTLGGSDLATRTNGNLVSGANLTADGGGNTDMAYQAIVDRVKDTVWLDGAAAMLKSLLGSRIEIA